VLLVTEHNAEVNAGFIVVFGSWHLPIVTETDSSGITFPRTDARRDKVAEIAQKVVCAYWAALEGLTSQARTS